MNFVEVVTRIYVFWELNNRPSNYNFSAKYFFDLLINNLCFCQKKNSFRSTIFNTCECYFLLRRVDWI